MYHPERTWQVATVDSPGELAGLLTQKTWFGCQGFRLAASGLILLNDSWDGDTGQDYAVVVEETGRQVDTVTSGWIKEARALERLQSYLKAIPDQTIGRVETWRWAEGSHSRWCHLCRAYRSEGYRPWNPVKQLREELSRHHPTSSNISCLTLASLQEQSTSSSHLQLGLSCASGLHTRGPARSARQPFGLASRGLDGSAGLGSEPPHEQLNPTLEEIHTVSHKVYQLVTDRVLALLGRGVVPWKRPWTTRGGRPMPPTNFVSGRPYRGINVFLLASQHWTSPYWLTFKQALEKGGHVRKGEQGTPIIFWKIDEPDEDGESLDASRKRLLLRYYTVFNLDQCEGFDTQDDVGGAAFDPIPSCEEIYRRMPRPPALRHGGDRAFYLASGDFVQMPRREAFSRPETYYSSLFHELAHATGHPSRLNRFALDENCGCFGSPGYAREELVAEMTAAMICGVLGIAPVREGPEPSGLEDDLLEASAAYIQRWIKVFEEDRQVLVLAAARAQKAADYILQRPLEALQEAA